jgi:serine/threonine protein kinase
LAQLYDFSTLTPLGKGDYGAVFALLLLNKKINSAGTNFSLRGPDDNKKTTVALKRTPLSPSGRPKLPAEAALWATLPPHPHLVRLRRVMRSRAALWFEMDYWGGGDLSTYLAGLRRENRRPTLPTTRRILTDVLRAVSALHARGMGHRDVKPANIYFLDDSRRRVGLGDFGFVCYLPSNGEALPLGGSSEEEGGRGGRCLGLDGVALAGTPKYMAPELFLDPPLLSVKGDVWSVAVIAVMMRAPPSELRRLGLTGGLLGASSLDAMGEVVSKVRGGWFLDDPTMGGVVAEMLRTDVRERLSARDALALLVNE